MIRFLCPNCRAKLTAPDDSAWGKQLCPTCGQKVQVPGAPTPPAPTPKTKLGIPDEGSPSIPVPPPVPLSYAVVPIDDRGGRARCHSTATNSATAGRLQTLPALRGDDRRIQDCPGRALCLSEVRSGILTAEAKTALCSAKILPQMRHAN